jgi:predicted membrane-bound dolichyl-phosphate-mannose-protein mannosyltransferase
MWSQDLQKLSECMFASLSLLYPFLWTVSHKNFSFEYFGTHKCIYIIAHIYSFIAFNFIAVLLRANAIFYWHSWVIH